MSSAGFCLHKQTFIYANLKSTHLNGLASYSYTINRQIAYASLYTGLRVPANTCQARADLAIRLSSVYTLSP